MLDVLALSEGAAIALVGVAAVASKAAAAKLMASMAVASSGSVLFSAG
jgi:hypothetical protein